MCALSEYPSGTYNQAVSVDMRCSTSGAFIFYTVDESEPTVHSNLYQGEPIRISNHVSVNDDPDRTPQTNIFPSRPPP
jgi:hypothetical protein